MKYVLVYWPETNAHFAKRILMPKEDFLAISKFLKKSFGNLIGLSMTDHIPDYYLAEIKTAEKIKRKLWICEIWHRWG